MKLGDAVNKGIAVVCALFFLAMSGPCLAVDAVALPTPRECYALPNAQGTDCLASVVEGLEPILQQYYDAALSSIRRQAALEEGPIADDLKRAITSLEHAQSAWRAYRDAHCDMVADLFMNGSGKADGGFVCTIDLTRLRIHELWQFGGFQPRSLPEPK